MRVRVVATLAAALSLSLALSAAAAPLDEARMALATGDLERARRVLEVFLATDPDRESAGEALYLLGSAATDAAQTFQSDTRLLEDFKSHPRAVDAALRSGQYLYATGAHERAAGYFHDLTRSKDPRVRSEGSLWLGHTLLALGEVGQAREAFHAAAEATAFFVPARLGEGDTYRAESKLEEALRRYESATRDRESPWRAAALFKCALAARDLDRLDDAREFVEELSREYPLSAEAAAALALVPAEDPGPPAPAPGGMAPAPGDSAPAAESTAVAAGEAAAFYSVQVGAFSERANAARLHEEIGDRGFPESRIVPGPGGDEAAGGVLYYVRFGRYATRGEAAAAGRDHAGPAGLSFQVMAEGPADTTATPPATTPPPDTTSTPGFE